MTNQRCHALAQTNHTKRHRMNQAQYSPIAPKTRAVRIAEAARRLQHNRYGAEYTVAKHAQRNEVIAAGCLREMIRMSYPEIGEVLGCSHSTALDRVKKYYDIPWRLRYEWLHEIEIRTKGGA